MPTLHRRATATALVAGLALLTACQDEQPTAPLPSASSAGAAGALEVCHFSADHPPVIALPAPALAAHFAHGDYIATYYVSPGGGAPDDGAHFGTIGEALAAARAGRLARGETVSAACRIRILVSAGVFEGTAGTASGELEQFPLIVDVPDITLQGALDMVVDADGRATGQGPAGGGESILRPTEPLPIVNDVSIPMIAANAHPGGSAGHGLVVEGFVFHSGHDPSNPNDGGGQGILTVRAERVTVRGNRFESGFTESIDIRGGSADVSANHLRGTAGTCDVCLAGPGTFRATGNRLLAGGIPGIVVSSPVGLPTPAGIEAFALPAQPETWAELRNNEVRDHLRTPVGVGLRIDAIGVFAPNVQGHTTAVLRDNVMIDNRFGLIVHGAFPRPNTALRGDVDVVLEGNVFQGSCQADLLVSFSRHNTTLGFGVAQPYLLNSTFRLWLGGDVSWDDAWFGHPAGYGNTLAVNGQTQPNGIRHFYDLATCPGQQS